MAYHRGGVVRGSNLGGVPPVEKIKCWMWGTCVVRGNRFGTSCTKTTPGHLKEMIRMATKKTSMFTLTERVTVSAGGTDTFATIDLGSYVDVGDLSLIHI